MGEAVTSIRCVIGIVWVLLGLSFGSMPAWATTEAGFAWLSSQQQAQGWVTTVNDLASRHQATHEALDLAALVRRDTLIDTALALDALSGHASDNTEYISQRLIHGITSASDGRLLLDILYTGQNADGGFADFPGYDSSPYDTFWALSALGAVGQAGSAYAGGALRFLIDTQASNGSWSLDSQPSIYLTSRILAELVKLRGRYALETQISAAINFLANEPSVLNLAEGDVFESAAALLALGLAVNDVSVLSAFHDALSNAQQVDGSWDNDVLTTALTLSALHVIEARQKMQQPEAGTVTGRVLVSGSLQPITGASVALAATGQSIETGSDGLFSLQGVTAGTHLLSISASGYQSGGTSVTVSAATTSSIGDIALAPVAGLAVLVGRLYDSESELPVAGAHIVLSGEAAYEATTNATGDFFMGAIALDTYQLDITATGYHALQRDLLLDKAVTYQLVQPVVAEGQVLDDQPVDLTGVVIDGVTRNPVSGVTVVLANHAQRTTDTAGQFVFENLVRGDYALHLSGEGFVSARYVLSLPAGGSGNLGNLALYPASDAQAAEAVSLKVAVTEVVSGDPLSGALVVVGEQQAVTDANGLAALSGIADTHFSLHVESVGYLTRDYAIEVSGFGHYDIPVALTPESDPSISSSSLSGAITDHNGNPVNGATVSIAGSDLRVTTDAEGRYTLTGIASLSFSVQVKAAGYLDVQRDITVEAFGNYTLNIPLQALTADAFIIKAIEVSAGTPSTDTTLLVDVLIENVSTETREVVMKGQVSDVNGNLIADLAAYVPGTETVAGAISFLPGEAIRMTLPWHIGQNPAGGYGVRVDAVDPETISRQLPYGVVYTSEQEFVQLGSISRIDGGLEFNPSILQAGSSTPVSVHSVIRNVGNEILPAGSYHLQVATQDGELVHVAEAVATELAVNAIQELDFGQWVPADAGHFSVTVSRMDNADVGTISAVYYVGDVATGTFTLDQTVFPEGTHLTHGQIQLRGVDLTQGLSLDPLYVQVRNAVTQGGAYVGNNAEAWQKRNRCSGCHIQTQSLLGLSAAANKADINQEQLVFLYNTIAGSQQNNGNLWVSDGALTPKTLGMLGSWSLTEWPDEESSFRTRYQALEYLWSVRSESASETFFRIDGTPGWMGIADEAGTAIVAKSITDLLLSHRTLVRMPQDYALGTEIPLSTQKVKARGTTVIGSRLYIAKQGAIEHVDFGTGETGFTYLDSANRVIVDVTARQDGTLLAATSSSVLQIAADGALSELPLGWLNITAVVEWNGEIYVADQSNRIVHLAEDGTATLFTSGGLLNRPADLMVAESGDLLVANYLGFNITSIGKDKVQSVHVDGLPFRPVQLTAAGEGAFYITTEHYLKGSSYTPAGILLVRPDRTVESIVRSSNYPTFGLHGYSAAVVNDTLYFIDGFNNTVRGVDVFDMNDALVGELQSGAAKVANYFLARHTRDPSQIMRASFKLIGLAELRKVITGEALLVEIDAAIDYIAQQLRSQQRIDGGWGRWAHETSDPVSTAWAGIALNYTRPSADDPMVRNTIIYLLGQQAADGSWAGGYSFTQSRLGSSSLVMVYMPVAQELLGGLGVDLDISLPANIGVGNLSVAPDGVEQQADGSTDYHWSLSNVTSSSRTIHFDMAIEDLVLGEARPVAIRARIAFANSFIEDEKLVRALGIPIVSATSELALETTTDLVAYQANQPVSITGLVTNNGPDFVGGFLRLSIRTQQGAEIAVFAEQTPIDLSADTDWQYSQTWNTGTWPAGAYQVFAQVLDASGRVQVQAVADFTILTSPLQDSGDVTYRARVGSDKPRYLPYDTVNLLSRVSNLAVNTSQAPVLAKIAVSGPAGNVLHQRQVVIAEMAPLAMRDLSDVLTLRDAAPGTYTASITLWDASVTEELARDITTFEVVVSPISHLEGSVGISAAVVERGESLICTDTLRNRSNGSAVTGELEQLLVAPETQQQIDRTTASFSLPAGAEEVRVRGIDTRSLEEGGYACVLQTTVNGETRVLGYADFKVIEPPVKVVTQVESTGRGRLLILLDAPAYHDNLDHTSIAAQRDMLRALLDAQGWSYTLVHSAQDFTREFTSGQYVAYALMANRQTLDPQLEALLAEAVNVGDGLLINGAFNRRDNKIEKAMGIGISGREQQAGAVVLPAYSLGDDWTEALLYPAVKYDIDRCEADTLAHYIDVRKGNNGKDKPHSACSQDSDNEAAVVRHEYGLGRSVFIAFDALDEATREATTDSAYAVLLKYAFDAIHPRNAEFELDVPRRTDKARSVALTLHSEGIAVSVRLRLPMEDTFRLLDAPAWSSVEENGVHYWQTTLMLAEGESRQLSLFLQSLRDQTLQLPLSIDVSTDDGASWALFETQHIEVVTDIDTPDRSVLEDALNAELAISPGSKNLKLARNHLDLALAAENADKTNEVVLHLLKAAAYLEDEAELGSNGAARTRLTLDRFLLHWLAEREWRHD